MHTLTSNVTMPAHACSHWDPVWALGRLSRQWWQQSPAPPATLPSGDTSCPSACALPTPGAL